tara:strand:- start:1590 stop:2966 length:1377 start_codon:yes stop_codon:yes gene_type:complete
MNNADTPSFDFVQQVRRNADDGECLIWNDRPETQSDFIKHVDRCRDRLLEEGFKPGDVAILIGDYSPHAVSMLIAMIEFRLIIVPATRESQEQLLSLSTTVKPNWIVTAFDDDLIFEQCPPAAGVHTFYSQLRKQDKSGLVLLTSGSTGSPKVVVHDLSKLLAKFETTHTAVRTINFLMFDHWGGLNTLFHCLASKSAVVFPTGRQPDYICSLIEKHAVQLLPATPTFLNMLLLSRAFEKFNLSSLKLITYGAEPMPESTLSALRKHFPCVELRQTYGLIELGVLQAKSASSDSLWVKIGGKGYDVRVVDGILQIKADSAMLGYLNAPSPFTDDGYFITGDRVERSGAYFRILGRDSELINVGGQKVFPAEVETVLLEHSAVDDAVVFGEQNAILGKIVCATVRVIDTSPSAAIKTDIARYCRERLEKYKVPVKIQLTAEPLHRDRFKRVRRQEADEV